MYKRFLSVFLSVLLLFCGFCLPVFASDGSQSDGSFWSGLKDVIVPSDDFFEDFSNDISSAVDRKFGAVGDLVEQIKKGFASLSDSSSAGTLTLTMPDNILFNGYKGTSVNILGGIGTFASWFKAFFSVFLIVVTIIFCYRRLIAMFNK